MESQEQNGGVGMGKRASKGVSLVKCFLQRGNRSLPESERVELPVSREGH